MLNIPSAAELRGLAVRLAEDAGEELLSRQAGLSIDAAGVETKTSASDPVSAADRASEKLITDGLAEVRPGDGLLGEEGASKASSTGLTWVIDPLDGTVNYLYGRLDWCVSIAVEDEFGALAGAVHQPRTGITWSAARGEGAQRNGVPLGPSREVGLAAALVSTGFSYLPERRAEQAEYLTPGAPRSTGHPARWVGGTGPVLGRRRYCERVLRTRDPAVGHRCGCIDRSRIRSRRHQRTRYCVATRRAGGSAGTGGCPC